MPQKSFKVLCYILTSWNFSKLDVSIGHGNNLLVNGKHPDPETQVWAAVVTGDIFIFYEMYQQLISEFLVLRCASHKFSPIALRTAKTP